MADMPYDDAVVDGDLHGSNTTVASWHSTAQTCQKLATSASKYPDKNWVGGVAKLATVLVS